MTTRPWACTQLILSLSFQVKAKVDKSSARYELNIGSDIGSRVCVPGVAECVRTAQKMTKSRRQARIFHPVEALNLLW